jgi:hypothetical protein
LRNDLEAAGRQRVRHADEIRVSRFNGAFERRRRARAHDRAIL